MHILHDNTLTQDNRDKFVYVAGRYGQVVKFYNVEQLCADKIAEMVRLVPQVKNSWLTIGAFYRLLITQILPEIDKIIYLDSDLIVNLDIAELWRVDIADKPISAVDTADAETNHFQQFAEDLSFEGSGLVADNYLNSGVLLMNLEYLRKSEDLILSGVKWYGEHPKLQYMDQDILNYLFSKSYLKLPVKFNTFVREERRLSRSTIQRKIYHYLAGNFGQGLSLDNRDPFNRLWMDYFIRTPWFNAQTIWRLFDELQNRQDALKRQGLSLFAILPQKQRVFFVSQKSLMAVAKLFAIRDEEEIIIADNQDSVAILFEAMKQFCGQKLFVVVYPGFPLDILKDAGFVQGKDFLDGVEFLSEANGVPFDSYSLVKAL